MAGLSSAMLMSYLPFAPDASVETTVSKWEPVDVAMKEKDDESQRLQLKYITGP